MADRIENCEQLQGEQPARELVRAARAFLRRKQTTLDFGLREQGQRAAVSHLANIAEGFESIQPGQKFQFYNAGRASCREDRSLSCIMLDGGFISGAEQKTLPNLAGQTSRLVSGLPRSSRARTENP